MAKPNKMTDDKINLDFLRNIDGSIKNIILNCCQSAVYEFNQGRWTRKNIEGTLFVVERSEEPLFKLVIPNKIQSDIDIFEEIITDNYEINLEKPYILCKNAKNVINCFWFYNKDLCEKFVETVQDCIKKLRDSKANLTQKLENLKLDSSLKPDIPQMSSLEEIERKLLESGNPVKPKAEQEPVVNNVQKIPDGTGTSIFESIFQSKPDYPQNVYNGNSVQQPVKDIFSNGNTETAKPQALPTMENVSCIPTACTIPGNLQTKPQAPATSNNPALWMNQNILQPQLYPVLQPFISPANVPPSIPSNVPTSTSKISVEELKQTIIHLLQNDVDFLVKVYETYKSRVGANQ